MGRYRFQSLRRDVLDSYIQLVYAVLAAVFGFNRSGAMFLDSYQRAGTVIQRFRHVSIAQARCFGFLRRGCREQESPVARFQSLRRDVLDSYIKRHGESG